MDDSGCCERCKEVEKWEGEKRETWAGSGGIFQRDEGLQGGRLK